MTHRQTKCARALTTVQDSERRAKTHPCSDCVLTFCRVNEMTVMKRLLSMFESSKERTETHALAVSWANEVTVMTKRHTLLAHLHTIVQGSERRAKTHQLMVHPSTTI